MALGTRRMRMLLAAGWLGVLAVAAHGHGGQYRGPGDVVPPNLGGAGDTNPPSGQPRSDKPGVPTDRPGAATGGGPGPGAPGSRAATGGGFPAPGSAGGGASRGRTFGGLTRRGRSEGFEQWEFWWEYNKEPYLRLRLHLAEVVKSGASALGVGRGDREGAVVTDRVSAEDAKNEILPALIAALSESDADVVDSAVLAIGRVLPRDLADLGFDAIVRTLGSEYTSAQEAATLSLGLLGDPRAIEILVKLMNDVPRARGQYLHSDRPTPNLVRAFAALSLGKMGQKDSIPLLENVIDREGAGQIDLKSCALIALGMFKSNQEAVIDYLLKVMESRDLDRMLRAYAPTSIARLGDAGRRVIPQLLQAVKSDKTDNDLLRSSVIALGKLATMQQQDVIDTLGEMALEHTDPQTRHFAFIALAEIGAHDEGADPSAEAHQRLLSFFQEALARPRSQTSLPWAGLGLAIYARTHVALQALAIPKLHRAFADATNPSYKAAMAIGLGLLEAKESAPLLVQTMKDSSDQQLKGYIALSLGLMRTGSAAELLREQLKQKGIDWRYRLNLARALGLLNDPQSVPTLMEELVSAKTLSESSSIAQALGLIGDRSSIQPLKTILADKAMPGKQRAFAAVALGLLAEKTDLPWNAEISVGLNYRAKTTAVAEILDIL
jgi:HEAT repeat protein